MKMKRIISLLLVAIMLFSLAACNLNSPEKALSDMLNALKAGELDRLGELNGDDSPEELTDEDKALFAAIYGKMDFKVGKAEINGESANVGLKLTVVDISYIMEQYVEEVLEHMLDSEWDYETYIKALVNSDKAKTKDFDITVPMKQKDGKWVIDESGDISDFIGALTGGIGI